MIYLGRIDFLEVLDDVDNPIGDLGFVKEGSPDLFRVEAASYGVEGGEESGARVWLHSLNDWHSQVLKHYAPGRH